MTFCMGQKGDRDEAAAGGTASAHPPIPGPLRLLPEQVTMRCGHSPWRSPSVSLCTHARLVTWEP